MTEEIMNPRQAAHFLGVAVSTMRHWRRENRGPAFLKYGRVVRYRCADLDRFIKEKTSVKDGEST